jgi:hypothetical protein
MRFDDLKQDNAIDKWSGILDSKHKTEINYLNAMLTCTKFTKMTASELLSELNLKLVKTFLTPEATKVVNEYLA